MVTTKPEKKKVSEKACMFNLRNLTIVEFADGADKNRFMIVGYSGEIIEHHWYWGNVAFDLGGVKFAKKSTPVLYSHDHDQRVGFSDEQYSDKNIRVLGPFLKSDAAQKIRQDMQDGFPFEASLHIRPSKVEEVKAGETANVNGKILSGPGAIFRKAIVKEVSLLTFGADSKTKAKAFSPGSERENIEFETFFDLLGDNDMGTETKELAPLTMEAFREGYAGLYNKVFDQGKAEGQKTERDLFTETVGICGEDSALAVKCFKEGITEPAEIFKRRTAGLEAAQTKLAEKAEAEKKASEFAEGTAEAADAEFKDDAKKHSQNTDVKTSEQEDGPVTEDKLKEQFNASKELQNDFASVEGYIAFKQAEAEGRVSGKGKGLKESA